ncbi:MAG: hypothetical protein IKQ69_05325, partial [Oscillospiraceae bacterium]|nr:hypothetical protein [Oscillospiraceae bacterium]
NDAFYFHYNSAGEMVGYTYQAGNTETECLLVKNQQGDVERVISTDGTILASYSYDAWGKVLTSTGTLAGANPIRYRGYYYDTETDLYYLQSRYYDPQVGRFLNADGFTSTRQGILGCNMYAYCLDNPVNGCDPSGHKKWYLDKDGNPQQDGQIIYQVPCLDQEETNRCWAYCILMRKSYEMGYTLAKEQMIECINSFGFLYKLCWKNNWGLPFFLQGKKADMNSIEDLFELLIDQGPVYAAYKIPRSSKGHIVLVTGVDIEANRVYTNNPWHVKGVQSFSGFQNDFCPGQSSYDSRFQLYAIYTPTF